MYDEDLTNLDEWIRRLKIEYHIFFNGHRAKPPDDLKFRVERLLKKLSECSDLTFSQRFRFSTLVTRYYVYRDLWRRTQQNHELGAETKNDALGSAPFSQNSSHPTATVRISISDPENEAEKVRELYEALLQIKGTDKQETQLSYPQFAKYIAAQTQSIQDKYGCPNVAFTIALENDAIRFTAVAENR
jgi:hypothetical protein